MNVSNNGTRFNYRVAAIPGFVAMLMMFFLTCTAQEPQQTTLPKTNQSTMMLALSLDQLVERADLILTGTVIGLEIVGDTGSKNIYTNAIIAVDKVIKGQLLESNVTVKVLGGDGSIEDSPSFMKNEKVLLFLKSNADNTMAIIGNMQGKCVIEDGKINSVVASMKGLSLSDFKMKVEALKK